MKCFISWSGEKSQVVADALRQWIPDVIQTVEPWMSAKDIDAGARWNREIQDQLTETKFGIICLTKNNMNSPWILFEVGAIAKTISDTFVCPYLIDLSQSEICQGPLTQFQAKKANEKETWELICSVNKALKDSCLPKEKLRRTFDRWWPDLNNVINTLPVERKRKETKRPTDEMVEEILEIVRSLARKLSDSDYTILADKFRYTLDNLYKLSDTNVRSYLNTKINKKIHDNDYLNDNVAKYIFSDPAPEFKKQSEDKKTKDEK